MEAKVDLRKLQILNDRIHQTIDALNQVRFTVHGLGHTGVPTTMMSPFGTFGFPTVPFPGVPATPPIPGLLGLQHNPYTPFMNPFFNVPSPYTTPIVNPTAPNAPAWGIPSAPWMGGLLHSPADPFELRYLEGKVLDPYRLDPYRMVQTFPYLIY